MSSFSDGSASDGSPFDGSASGGFVSEGSASAGFGSGSGIDGSGSGIDGSGSGVDGSGSGVDGSGSGVDGSGSGIDGSGPGVDGSSRGRSLRERSLRDGASRDRGSYERSLRERSLGDGASRGRAFSERSMRDHSGRGDALDNHAFRERSLRDRSLHDRSLPDGERRPKSLEELHRHGPNLCEAAIRVHAEKVTDELAAERDKWSKGFTRRRLVQGAGFVGVAALGTQLVTSRVSFAAPEDNKNTLIVIFLRGGMDGLSVVAPGDDANYRQMRPNIAVPMASMKAAGRGFGLNPAMTSLYPLWDAGKMAAVHAVASPDASRSHFQAQDALERGAASVAVRTGWLDRVLAQMGPGTTFRAIAQGSALPRSLVGGEQAIVLNGMRDFRIDNDNMRTQTMDALKTLYTGLDHPLAGTAGSTLQAISTAQKLANTQYRPAEGVQYPGGGLADRLRDIAQLLKANVGLRIAALDVGGWDMHTNLGRVDGGDMKNSLTNLSDAIGAFCTDIGPLLDNTTIITMSEFGRRVQENGNVGVDHGHGNAMLLFGGGLNGGKVHGNWPGLSPSSLDQGDVAGANDYRDILAEMLKKRFGVGDSAAIFPNHDFKQLGVFKG
ncbi:DUF1501 domain-containing protein [Dactylosporangium sp. CA-139114]|uniref:DUF1501 domain-containing protein n=1 Tax=Dactylosporangium sp. CA-139114 TaxID=3239931 RepID=UPI003D9817F7